MAKIIATPIGKIVKGDFTGQYLYKWDSKTWGICPGSTLQEGFLVGKLHWEYFDSVANKWEMGNWNGPTNDDRIAESTVDHYEEIGANSSGPDASAMLQGTIIGGVGLGLIAGAASSSSTNSVAIFLKNGKSFIVHFYDSKNWIELKSMLYSIDTPKQKTISPPQPTSTPSPDKFEAIKKYKELLDMGIITQEEFNKKKSELLGLDTINKKQASSISKATDHKPVISSPPNNCIERKCVHYKLDQKCCGNVCSNYYREDCYNSGKHLSCTQKREYDL